MLILDRETRAEIKDIIRATVAEVEIESVKAVSDLREEIAKIPHMVAQDITRCRRDQESRRRWGLSTWVALIAVAIAAASWATSHTNVVTALTP